MYFPRPPPSCYHDILTHIGSTPAVCAGPYSLLARRYASAGISRYRVSVCSFVRLFVRLSVCVSVTRRYCT